MRVSTKARYAVMAMVELAQINRDGKIASLSTISIRQDLPLPYLEQLFVKLRKAGLVKSIRGASGGYMPAKEPEAIRIFDIIMAVEKPIKATRCEEQTGKGCHIKSTKCSTHDLWVSLEEVVIEFLKGVTLEDACHKKYIGRALAREKSNPILESMVG